MMRRFLPRNPVPENRRKKKKKETGWDAKTTKCWIYVTGLLQMPTFQRTARGALWQSKAIARDLENAPKIKLYRDDAGSLKGDASLCYANASSVDVACSILDGGSLRLDVPSRVTKARFWISARYGAFDQSKVKKVNPQKARGAAGSAAGADHKLCRLQWRVSGQRDADRGVLRAVSRWRMLPCRRCSTRGSPSMICSPRGSAEGAVGFARWRSAPTDRAVVHRHGVVVFKFKEPSDAQKSVKVRTLVSSAGGR